MSYIRTCQECGHKQEMKPPAGYKNDTWKDLKCRKCKSPALDYGSDGWERNPQTGNWEKPDEVPVR